VACFFYLQLGSQRLEETSDQKTRISVQTVAEGCKCPKSSRTRLSTTIVYQMVPKWTLKPKPWSSPPELSAGALHRSFPVTALRRSSPPELFAGALRRSSSPELSRHSSPPEPSAGALHRSSSPELSAGALHFQGAGSRFRVSGLGFRV